MAGKRRKKRTGPRFQRGTDDLDQSRTRSTGSRILATLSTNSAANGRISTASFERRFEEALAFRNAAEYERALDILLKLRRQKPKSASVHGILGDVYWRMHRLKHAVSSFRRATKLSPASELASLGLSHTQQESGQAEKARAERRRFLSLSRANGN